MADFSKYTNYKNNAGVSGVVFGANSTVLEVELNEMQEIQKVAMRDLIRNIVGNGITDISKLVYEDGKVKILDDCGITADGYHLNCSGLEIAITSGTVYLQVWEETVDYSGTLKEDGNQQKSTTVVNWFKDTRSQVETTKRKVVKYTLGTSQASGRTNVAIAKVASGSMAKLINEVNINKLAEATKTIGYTDDSIYGVEADWKNNRFVRLNGSVGKSGGSDYDNIKAFARRKCNITDTGVITAYYGDDGYTETGKTQKSILVGETTIQSGTRVQTMVEQNKFYYKVVPLELEKISDGIGYKMRKARYYLSDTPKDGFKVHPAFKRNGVEYDRIYIGAYKASLYDTSEALYVLDDSASMDTATDKLASIAGAKPTSGITNNLTRANCRKMAGNIGTGWQIIDFTIACMNAYLFLVEYAKMNAQEVLGNGVSSISDDGSSCLAAITGGTANIGNGSGMAAGTNGQVSIIYRGMEDPFGSIWEFVDGLNIEAKGKNIGYWANHSFADDTANAPYQSLGFTIAKTNGYISAFGWSEDCDWAFIAAETAGDSSKPVGDYQWQNATYNGWFIALLGGSWSSGSNCGLCYWGVDYASSNRNRHIGSRLVYIPLAA